MVDAVKRLCRRFFGSLGLEVHKRVPETVQRASMLGALRQIAGLGFRPETVIDVGVATQTRDLYETFPSAAILLIEPLAEFEPFLKKICEKFNAQYVLAAAGGQSGVTAINVHADKFGSSFLKEVEGPMVDGAPRQVPVVTIDQLCQERRLRGPFLMKVDVQGSELQVMEGAIQTLKETEAIMLEVTLFETMIDGPQLLDVISRMRELGFVAYDICGFLYRPLDGALCQVDMLFVQGNGRFRQSHAYATADQRKVLASYA